MQTIHRGLPQNWCRHDYGAMRETSVKRGLGAPKCDCLSAYADQAGCGDCAKIVAKRNQSAFRVEQSFNAEAAKDAEGAKNISNCIIGIDAIMR